MVHIMQYRTHIGKVKAMLETPHDILQEKHSNQFQVFRLLSILQILFTVAGNITVEHVSIVAMYDKTAPFKSFNRHPRKCKGFKDLNWSSMG